MNGIVLEKTGGVITSDNEKALKWINEDTLEITYKHYKNEVHLYRVDFNTNKISEDINILH